MKENFLSNKDIMAFIIIAINKDKKIHNYK